MRETNDGFRIAEEDLRLRGPGEILGTRQSGEEAFRVARRRTSPSSRQSPRAMRGCCSTATAGSRASAARRRGFASICSNATRRWG